MNIFQLGICHVVICWFRNKATLGICCRIKQMDTDARKIKIETFSLSVVLWKLDIWRSYNYMYLCHRCGCRLLGLFTQNKSCRAKYIIENFSRSGLLYLDRTLLIPKLSSNGVAIFCLTCNICFDYMEYISLRWYDILELVVPTMMIEGCCYTISVSVYMFYL